MDEYRTQLMNRTAYSLMPEYIKRRTDSLIVDKKHDRLTISPMYEQKGGINEMRNMLKKKIANTRKQGDLKSLRKLKQKLADLVDLSLPYIERQIKGAYA